VGYLNKEIVRCRLGKSCYVLTTVQPGTAMTVQEIGACSGDGVGLAFSRLHKRLYGKSDEAGAAARFAIEIVLI
jgi:hypothetical protein